MNQFQKKTIENDSIIKMLDLKKIKQIIHIFAIWDWLAVIITLSAGLGIGYFSFADDYEAFINSDINNPLKTSTVPYPYLCSITFGVGSFITLAIWLIHKPSTTAIRVVASYYFSITFTILISCGIKRLVGRPRPDTLTLCGGDGSYQTCKQVLSKGTLSDQFQSFPSGHAAESMACAMFISLLLNEIWNMNNMFGAMFKFSPICLSLFVGISRIWDRAHHVEDVVAGFLIGGLIAYFSFSSLIKGIKEEEDPNGNPLGNDTSASTSSIPMKNYV